MLVVGGGLGGFTAALSLHRAGIQNSIIMRETRFTQYPRSWVFLGASAIRILDRLGLGPQYRALGTPMHRIQIDDVRAKRIIEFKLADMGTEVWTVPKEHLQQVFLEAIPPESVFFDSKFRSLQVTAESVQVKIERSCNRPGLADAVAPSLFDTNYVVGADGLTSAVRMYMSAPVTTVSSGVFVWKAVVSNTDLDQFPLHIGKEVWDVNRKIGFARLNQEEVVWWAVASNCSEVLLRPFTPHLLRLFGAFPSYVLDLISSVESDREIHRAEMTRVWPEQVPWVDHRSGRVALVGDAARPGNAGNFHTSHTLAVEDSYVLASHLAEQNEKGMLERGPNLEKYEANRREKTATTDKLSHRFNHLSLSQTAIHRYFVKKLLQFSVERLAARGFTSTAQQSS